RLTHVDEREGRPRIVAGDPPDGLLPREPPPLPGPLLEHELGSLLEDGRHETLLARPWSRLRENSAHAFAPARKLPRGGRAAVGAKLPRFQRVPAEWCCPR